MRVKLFFTAITMLVLLGANAQNLNYDTELNESALFLKTEHDLFPKKATSWKYINKWAKKTTKKVPHLYIDEVNKQSDGIMDSRALRSSGAVYDRFLFEELMMAYVRRYQMINWAELMFTYNSRMDRIPFAKDDKRYDPN